MYKTNVE